MEVWYQLTSTYYCAAIITRNNRVVMAVLIIRWMVGKTINEIAHYCKSKGIKAHKLKDLDDDRDNQD